jgi:hypothetical protein
MSSSLHSGHRGRRAAWDVAVGAAAAVLAFAAVPGVLAGLVGLPLPSHWSASALLSLHGLFDVLAAAAWLAWAACAWPLLRSVIARVRARDASSGATTSAPLRFGDRLAFRIATAVLALAPLTAAGTATAAGASITGGPLPAAAAQAGAGPSAAAAGRSRETSGHLVAAATQPAGGHPNLPQVRPAGTVAPWVSVREGDSLWTIASAAYDDAAAWPAVASANLGRVMNDGARFVDPNVVRPGWTLAVPLLDHPGSDVVTTVTRPAPDGAPDPGHPARRESGDLAGGSGRPVPASLLSGLLLPELAILGTGTLVAALLARRSRQAQRLRSFVREEGSSTPEPSESAADLGRVLATFEHVPLLHMVEAAVRMLSSSARAIRDDVRLPALQLVRAGADGVAVCFASVPPPAPPPWVPGERRAWVLPAALDSEGLHAEASRHRPWAPILLPLGEDERGSWLLPLGAGASLSVIGPAAGALAHAMVAGTQNWTWREELVVTSDPQLAAQAAGIVDERPDGSVYPQVLFTGDAGALTPTARRVCAVITLGANDAAEISVIADERAATVHPLALTVRPHLLDRAWAPALTELGIFDPDEGREPGANGGPGASEDARPRTVRPNDLRPNGRHPNGDAAPPSPAFRQRQPGAATVRVRELERSGGEALDARHASPPTPGRVGRIDVRLLVPVPSVDGLAGALPAKRARRATELIAYLALHAPHPVTGDRLRTRVLGTADADAAAKTLFNTVGAARHALGSGADGTPVLPPATRSGHYCLSSAVTVDTRRCVAMIEAARATEGDDERMARLHDALAHVEGEPLSGVLSGYGWWRAEGHERRVADAVVDGACALVRAAIGAGHVDLGRWALGKARLVEPYSEALTRAAMALAAAAGDARRFHLEWEVCCRQVDELDPGGTPSEATERLYVRLRQRFRSETPAGEPTAVLRS